jgi:hypothetical protein
VVSDWLTANVKLCATVKSSYLRNNWPNMEFWHTIPRSDVIALNMKKLMLNRNYFKQSFRWNSHSVIGLYILSRNREKQLCDKAIKSKRKPFWKRVRTRNTYTKTIIRLRLSDYGEYYTSNSNCPMKKQHLYHVIVWFLRYFTQIHDLAIQRGIL